jgi:hypothetical protein
MDKKIYALILFVLLVSTINAFDFDNVKEEVGLTANGSLEFDGRYIPNNNLWNKYKPLDIKNAFGLGSTLFRGYIDKHTESCSNNCESKIVVKLYSNGVLFDSIKFKRLIENEWIDTSVPYAIFIKVGEENITELEYETECDESGEFWGNGTEKVECITYLKGNKTDQRDIWTSYNLGDELAAGTYKVKIVGLKPREETVDWIITSQGKEITEWALWGSAALVLEETPSLTLTGSTYTTDTNRGIKIKPFVNMTLVNITRYAGVTGTNCSIYSEANGFLKNGTFIGEQCTLNYNLVANTIYRLKINSGIIAYTARYKAGEAFPKTTGVYLNITTGLDSTGTDDTVWWNIGNLTIAGLNTVNLNSPVDYYNSSSRNIGFNFTVSVLSSNISTVDLWTNVTGVFNRTLRGDINSSGSQEESPSAPGTITVETTGSYGMELVTNKAFTIGNVTLFRNDNKTTCWLQNADSSITYKTANIINGQCELNYDLEDSTMYRIKLYSGGIMHNMTWNNAVTYPKTTTDGYFTWNAGLDSSGIADASSWYEIGNVTIFSETGIIPSGVNNLTSLLNYTFTSDGNYIWGLRVCDVGGDCGFSENRTISIDTASPIITIISPQGIYNYSYLGENRSLNFTVNGTDLNTCWYEYAGINTTINCTLNNTYIQNTSNTIRLWANDTIGNIDYEDSNWTYIIFGNSVVYNSVVYEASNQNYTLNMTYNSSAYTSVSANLVYNNTNYSSVIIGTGNNIKLYNSLTTPLTSGQENKSFYWDISLDSNHYYTSTYNQTLSDIAFGLCSGTLTTQVINFSTKSAINPFPSVNATFKAAWEVSGTPDGETLDYNFEDVSEVNSTWRFCTTGNATVYADAHIEYDATGYALNSYYLTNATLTNYSNSISLYLLNDSLATTTVLLLRDDSQTPIQDATIQIQSYDVGTGTFYTVAVAKTDFKGEDVVYLNWYDTLYKFTVTKNGEVLKITNTTRISSTPVYLDIESSEVFPLDKFQDFTYNLYYNNVTQNFVLTFVKPSGEVDSGCLRVIKRSYTNDTQICLTCETSTSATVSCNIASYGNGTFIAIFYATGSYDEIAWIMQTIGKDFAENIYDLLGNDDASFYAFLFAGIVMAMFFINPILGIIGTILGIAGATALGFTITNYITFSGIIIVGIIILWFFKK